MLFFVRIFIFFVNYFCQIHPLKAVVEALIVINIFLFLLQHLYKKCLTENRHVMTCNTSLYYPIIITIPYK